MSKDASPLKGSCLCGRVHFTVQGDLAPADACHCSDCRKFSGHFFVSTDVPQEKLSIEGRENITWFSFSEKVQRGFCSTCGSSLFWDPIAHDWIAIAMGAFEQCTNSEIAKHIWVSDKGDYYEILDGLPQNDT